MNWKKEKPLESQIVGCEFCGYKSQIAPLEKVIAVGFGNSELLKNDMVVWEEGNKEFEDCITFADAEEIAKQDPDNDWRVHLLGPLSEVEYQRQDEGQWVLIKAEEGFA